MAAAVAAGIGASLLPRYACQAALEAGAVVEVGAVGADLPAEPWLASTPVGGPAAGVLDALVDGLGVPTGPR